MLKGTCTPTSESIASDIPTPKYPQDVVKCLDSISDDDTLSLWEKYQGVKRVCRKATEAFERLTVLNAQRELDIRNKTREIEELIEEKP